jgi:Zn-dependent peptidase ImmA (M78 family)/DNA-binding XRE family transcriptional regulator
MAITAGELARRLRAARESCQLTQDQVARHLGVSRPTIAQIEAANRAVSSLELDRLAYLYGRDIREFLAEAFQEEDVLVALFRRHPDVPGDETMFHALRQSLVLGREITNLEQLLGIDRDLTAVATYPLPAPRTKWEAVQQGERVAAEERRRLGLGEAPLPDVAELLEGQGIRTAQADLPEDVSGLTLVEPEVGILVVANLRHHVLRRRFSYAHEYAHVLLDREQRGTVSRTGDRDTLLEVRANALAATFLLPEEGVRQFVQGLAKGRPSRERLDVYDEEEVLRAEARSAPGSQAIQMYDVVLVAHHFGVSRSAALFRLKNLGLIDASDLDALQEQERKGLGDDVTELLGLPKLDHQEARQQFRRRFLGLAIEAFRREEITRAKLRELAALVDTDEADLERVLEKAGIDEPGPAAVDLPKP